MKILRFNEQFVELDATKTTPLFDDEQVEVDGKKIKKSYYKKNKTDSKITPTQIPEIPADKDINIVKGGKIYNDTPMIR